MSVSDASFNRIFNGLLKETVPFFNAAYGIILAWKEDEQPEITATFGKLKPYTAQKTEFSVKNQEFQQLVFEGYKFISKNKSSNISRTSPLKLIPESAFDVLSIGFEVSSMMKGIIYLAGSADRPIHMFSDNKLIRNFRNILSISISNYLLYKNLDNKQRSSIPAPIRKLKLIGESKAIKEINKMIELVSKGTSTVLIRGESGTGKEIVARLIHHLSDRESEQFVRINCAAIPENLLESELFGHEKGAFTGAISRRIGKFELANNGTIFLDEIGEIPPQIQVKLLNVLQEREFTRIGGNEMIKVNVRIIAATNRNLEKAIKNKMFREDLYYRLNVMPIIISPLRDRLEDIAALTNHFINQFNEELNLKYRNASSEIIFLLQKYNYPGNIRELENIIERALVIGNGEIISPSDLPKEIFGLLSSIREDKDKFAFREHKTGLWDVEKGIIERALRECSLNQSRAARELGITRNQLRYRIKKFRISIPKFTESEF